jgi:hypothetical protein
MTRVILSFALMATAAAGFAQTKPDFTGTWKLNVAKSDFGPLPGPESRTDTIVQTASDFKDSVVAAGAQGNQAYTITYTLDGKESINRPGGMELHSVANIEGATLVVNTKLKFQDNDVEVHAVWSLSPDGKTLTSANHLTSPMGEADQKFVFEKQDGSAMPAATAGAASATTPATTAPAVPTPKMPSSTPTASGPKPNFSGTWKLNVAKSDFGVMPAPEFRTDIIDHHEPALKVTTSTNGAEGKQDFTITLSTDGKEAVNTIMGSEVKSIAAWDGPTLVVTSKLRFNDTDVTIKSVYVLGDDGKTLNVNSHIASAMGEMDQKYIYEKGV